MKKYAKNIQLAKNRMRLPDEYFIERSVGDLKIPILCPENCNQSGASISAKMLVSWLKACFYVKPRDSWTVYHLLGPYGP